MNWTEFDLWRGEAPLIMRVYALFFFLPFFAWVGYLWRSQRGALHRGMIRNEIIALATTFGALMGTLFIHCTLLYWILMHYRVSPATLEGIALYFPLPVQIIIDLFSLVGLIYLGRVLSPLLGSRPLPSSYRLCATVDLSALGILILLGWHYNVRWAGIFLGVPAYLWLMAPPPSSRGLTMFRTGIILAPLFFALDFFRGLAQHPYGYIIQSGSSGPTPGFLTPMHAVLVLGLIAVGWRLLIIRGYVKN